LIVHMILMKGQPRGKRFFFPPGEHIIGRGSECFVRPNSELISRQHCLVRVAVNQATIADLGSRNGTLLNGSFLAAETLLKDGDEVQLGPLVFRIIFDESKRLFLPREVPPAALTVDDEKRTVEVAKTADPG
jgi:pSer/pThr/pTyr-binding forkhead associated (FHA) protein